MHPAPNQPQNIGYLDPRSTPSAEYTIVERLTSLEVKLDQSITAGKEREDRQERALKESDERQERALNEVRDEVASQSKILERIEQHEKNRTEIFKEAWGLFKKILFGGAAVGGAGAGLISWLL